MTIADRYRKVSEKIKTAAAAAGRSETDVRLIAVSKTHPAATVEEAIAAGAFCFGENKVQEGVQKIEEIDNDAIEWHLIGHLQKNKVRKAVQCFNVIQTVDSLKIAKRLERIAGEESRAPTVLIQVDLAGEATKSGIDEAGLFELADYLKEASNLEFTGLMTIPPFFKNAEDVRPYFRKLCELRNELREERLFSADGGELSMGMSHDYHVAIEEGATMVRIGTAIFGAREQFAE